jgi:ribonuclease VapC
VKTVDENPASSEASPVVLDSYAMLAYLNAEQGEKRVQEILEQAQHGKRKVYLSLINLGEVLYITERRHGLHQAQRVLGLIESLPLELCEVNRELVLDAAHLKANHTISYADAFVIALAKAENANILTGDPEFKAVDDVVRLEWLS